MSSIEAFCLAGPLCYGIDEISNDGHSLEATADDEDPVDGGELQIDPGSPLVTGGVADQALEMTIGKTQ